MPVVNVIICFGHKLRLQPITFLSKVLWFSYTFLYATLATCLKLPS